MSNEDIAKAETISFSQAMVPATMLARGHRVGPYEILRPIGRGGVGAVYHARVAESCALPVGREVALKILRNETLSESDHRRFTREAAYLQALSHHGITRIHDVGDYGGRPYLVMELVDGQCLDELIGRDSHIALPADHACDMVIQVLEGLHVAHIAGITHRDLKPGNLMITRQGRVKILDFGMAQRMSGESRLTASGSILGTPAYMAPEQARGHREWIGAHSDIYAMGAVLYELVTGYQPFRAENSVAILRAIIEEPLTPPTALVPDLPKSLETIILRAMAKDPRDRYANAESMAEDLRRFRRGQRPKAQRIPFWRPWLRTAYYYRNALAVSALALFVTTSFALALTLRFLQQSPATDPQNSYDINGISISNPETSAWITVWTHPETLGESVAAAASWGQSAVPGPITYTPVDPENRDRSIRVESDLRLAFNLRHNGVAPHPRILFSDSGVTQGYALAFQQDRILLKRPRLGVGENQQQLAVVASSHWPWTGEDVTITVERIGNEISVHAQLLLSPESALLPFMRYRDLIPLEGSEHSRIHFQVRPSNSRLWNIVIERKPRSELISRLELGDALRQEGHYQRAEHFYRDFIRDFPDSPRIRDAQYRRALCLVAIGRHSEALDIFLAVARENEDDPVYYVPATFQAWQSALRLGRFDEAQRYFEAIRSRYDLNTLLAYASQELLTSLPQRYLNEAQAVAPFDPWRAITLYDSLATIATYLEQATLYAQSRLRSSDVLISLQQWDEAVQRLEFTMNIPHNYDRDAILRLAQLERLRGSHEQSEAYYKEFLASIEDNEEDAGWARLWLADLYTAMNRHQDAYLLWREAADNPTIAGEVAKNLLGPLDEVPLIDAQTRVNDIAYFNAIAGALAGNRDHFEEWFQSALSLSDPFDWPQPLLNDAWESEVHLMEAWHRYPARQGFEQDQEFMPRY